MMVDTLRYGAVMVAAGVGIPILAALNAQLGTRVGSAIAATVVLFGVAFCAARLMAVATGALASVKLATAQPPFLLTGGVLIAGYVLSVTYVAPRFGLGNAILCVLRGQMACAAAIDQFGLLGAVRNTLSPRRAVGLALMIAGIVLAQRR